MSRQCGLPLTVVKEKAAPLASKLPNRIIFEQNQAGPIVPGMDRAATEQKVVLELGIKAIEQDKRGRHHP